LSWQLPHCTCKAPAPAAAPHLQCWRDGCGVYAGVHELQRVVVATHGVIVPAAAAAAAADAAAAAA
jgi:hypothetical protein